MGFVHFFGLFCLLAATVLMVVVSVSTPIWESVYFLKATVGGSSSSGLIKLGQWGYCVANTCSKSKLGYNLDGITSATNGEVSASIVHGLTYALVLNPIAAGFSFIALLFALCSNLALGILASVLAAWAFLVTIIALALDLGLFVTARHRLNQASDNVNASFGNALWLVVAAAACQLVAALTVCFTHSSSKRQRRRDVETRGLTTGEPTNTGRRGWFGRGSKTNTYGNNNAYANNNTTTTGAPVMNEKRHFWQRNKAVSTY